MGSPVEIIPGWSAINEKLDSTLIQLNRLMHYYADETPPADLRDPDPRGKKVKMIFYLFALVKIEWQRWCLVGIREDYFLYCALAVFYVAPKVA